MTTLSEHQLATLLRANPDIRMDGAAPVQRLVSAAHPTQRGEPEHEMQAAIIAKVDELAEHDPRWRLVEGNCLDILPTLEAQSIDAIITDLPYGTTACKWDEVIPFVPMWEQVKRVLKPRGVFVTTASQPFTSALVMSNAEWFKWADIWQKTQARGFLNAYVMPLREHEDILVFGDGRVTFNPQFTAKPTWNIRPDTGPTKGSECYGSYGLGQNRTIAKNVSFPRSVIREENVNNGERVDHPTQKPVALYEYLIRTYTNPGDTVLDFTMGSGTTGVAAIKEGRCFVGIELDPGYFAVARRRIQDAAAQPMLFEVTA